MFDRIDEKFGDSRSRRQRIWTERGQAIRQRSSVFQCAKAKSPLRTISITRVRLWKVGRRLAPCRNGLCGAADNRQQGFRLVRLVR